jgi:hypothetical protein
VGSANSTASHSVGASAIATIDTASPKPAATRLRMVTSCEWATARPPSIEPALMTENSSV